jgi:hypothetical protein
MGSVKYFLIFVVACLLLGATLAKKDHKHKCVHDSIDHHPVPDNVTAGNRLLTEMRSLQGPTWNPLRIYVDYSALAVQNVSANFAGYIQSIFIPNVVNFFQQAILVVQNPGVNMTVPAGFQCNTWTVINPVNVAADLVIWITTINDPTATYVAYSSSCMQSSINNRPNAAQINLNLYYFDLTGSDPEYMAVKHEFTHALGFSKTFYQYFVQSGTTTPLGLVNSAQNMTIRGGNVTAIVTQAVLAQAQQYFNCSNLTAVELENEGQTASIGSHWDSRSLQDDVMVASNYPITYYGEMTAAFLNGTGWYQVDMDMINKTQFGRGKGCGFMQNLCINNNTFAPVSAEFCTGLGGKGCTNDGRFKAICSYTTGTPAQAQWNYFNNNTMGFDTHTDNCPVWVGYTSGDCRVPANNKPTPLFVESYGFYGRCVAGTFSVAKYANPYATKPATACFETHCLYNFTSSSYTLTINIGGVQNITCPQAGSTNFTLTGVVTGYNGSIICPPAQQVCVHPICPNLCSGNGQCWDGRCICNSPFTAVDCSS